MSALFSPISLRDLALPNRIMVAPMCQYSAEGGKANGRITPGCLGLWNDATESALRPVLASVRRHSTIAIAIQLAHAGRKGSSHKPWEGGQQIPLAEGGWQTVGPSAVAHKDGELKPLELDAVGLKRVRDAFVESARRASGLGIDAAEFHRHNGYLP